MPPPGGSIEHNFTFTVLPLWGRNESVLNFGLIKDICDWQEGRAVGEYTYYIFINRVTPGEVSGESVEIILQH